MHQTFSNENLWRFFLCKWEYWKKIVLNNMVQMLMIYNMYYVTVPELTFSPRMMLMNSAVFQSIRIIRKNIMMCAKHFPTTPSSLTANAMNSIAAKLLPSEFYFMGFSSWVPNWAPLRHVYIMFLVRSAPLWAVHTSKLRGYQIQLKKTFLVLNVRINSSQHLLWLCASKVLRR